MPKKNSHKECAVSPNECLRPQRVLVEMVRDIMIPIAAIIQCRFFVVQLEMPLT